ncbi:MAG: UbiA family prenyltransferase [Flavobacteriales bacterium]|nr:UbiA family prenyltransferase [Flavobacteriales bacterium]
MAALWERISESSRTKDWRLSLLPFIMGCVYLWLWHFQLSWEGRTVLLIVLSLITATGFAALGYFINEFFDQSDDAMAGKANRMAPLTIGQRCMLLSGILIVAVCPWVWLPSDLLSWVLISAQVGLLLVYSLPFPRLKVVPVVSNLVDMGYAYLVPLMLSFHTYSLFVGTGAVLPIWLFPLMFVAALIGLRNILIHQVNDLFNDRRAGVVTMPQLLGPNRTSTVLFVLLVLEIAAFLSFGMMLSYQDPVLAILPVLFAAFCLLRLYVLRDIVVLRFLALERTRHLPDPFYQLIFPVMLLLALSVRDWHWLLLLTLHSALMTPVHVLSLLSDVCRNTFWWADSQRPKLRSAISAMVNYPIYWLFRLFGVDLVREEKSAVDFIKSKLS